MGGGELEEYPDLPWNPDSGVIQELVGRLCIVGVKPHCVNACITFISNSCC